jgi:hypothetical protein
MRKEFFIPTAAPLNFYPEDMELFLEKAEKAIRDALTENVEAYSVTNLDDYRLFFTIDIDCRHGPRSE